MSIVVTGRGALSALGAGIPALLRGLAEGISGIRPIERFATDAFSVHLGATVPEAPGDATALSFAHVAAIEATREAGLRSGAARARGALVLGTSLGDGESPPHEDARRLAALLGIDGPVLTVSTACSSSTAAVGIGKDLLDGGLADWVLAGGADALTPELFAGFHALGLLCNVPCSPFGSARGTTLGEGAGFVLLEREEDAEARGARVLARVFGYGLSSDAYHATSPDPTGAGVARAIRAALAHAGVAPSDVGYVNAHGTGTEANDVAEWKALESVFGDSLARIDVSSTKGHLGHAQGAAGILELLATWIAIEGKAVPPTLHFDAPRARGPLDPVAGSALRPSTATVAVSTNSAFAGSNAAVVVGSADAAHRAPIARSRPVYVRGVGAAGPFGIGIASLTSSVASGQRIVGRAAPMSWPRLLPSFDARGVDVSGRLVTAAAALALEDGKLPLRGTARDRAGLFLGAARVSPSSAEEFHASIRERGLAKLSASAFTRMVMNAPGGIAAKALGLRGPGTTVATGGGGGLVALVLGATLLARSGRDFGGVDHLVVVGVDELHASEPEGARFEGAAAVLLTGERTEVRLAGYALGGAGHLTETVARACKDASIRVDEADTLHLSRAAAGDAEASRSLFEAALAVDRVRRGAARALVVTEPAGSSVAAVVFLREEA